MLKKLLDLLLLLLDMWSLLLNRHLLLLPIHTYTAGLSLNDML